MPGCVLLACLCDHETCLTLAPHREQSRPRLSACLLVRCVCVCVRCEVCVCVHCVEQHTCSVLVNADGSTPSTCLWHHLPLPASSTAALLYGSARGSGDEETVKSPSPPCVPSPVRLTFSSSCLTFLSSRSSLRMRLPLCSQSLRAWVCEGHWASYLSLSAPTPPPVL